MDRPSYLHSPQRLLGISDAARLQLREKYSEWHDAWHAAFSAKDPQDIETLEAACELAEKAYWTLYERLVGKRRP